MSELLHDLQKVLEADLADLDLGHMPLLAHYTTLDALEKILRNDEVWFSHPTLMNDHAEVLEGVRIGTQHVLTSKALANALAEACTPFEQGYLDARNEYGTVHLFDTFIFSLSAHEPMDHDGRLSMWRGYGADGNGAALVINPGKLVMTPGSPLVFDRVHYKTIDERLDWLDDFCTRVAGCLQGRAATHEEWRQAGKNTFDRIKLAAIFSKHKGFEEEQEWRIVYMPERDPSHLLKDQISYFNGPHGLEPKLKYKIKQQANVADGDPRLVSITDRIILGPSRANLVLVNTARRMLEEIGKPQLQAKVFASSIPFRSSV